MATLPKPVLSLRDHLAVILGDWKRRCGNVPMPMKAILVALEERGHAASSAAVVANRLKRSPELFVRKGWGMYGLRNGRGR